MKELQLKCLKCFAQELTAANKHVRMTRAQQLLDKNPSHTVNFMFFTDEQLFSPSLAPPIRRTIISTSVRVPERRTSTKTVYF